MRGDKPPSACPRCGSPHTARVIWRAVYLSEEDEQDVATGVAVVASPHQTEGYEPWVEALKPRAGNLPQWVCLACTPGWMGVSRQAVEDYRRQVDKEVAVAAADFDRARELRRLQEEGRERIVTWVAKLLSESD